MYARCETPKQSPVMALPWPLERNLVWYIHLFSCHGLGFVLSQFSTDSQYEQAFGRWSILQGLGTNMNIMSLHASRRPLKSCELLDTNLALISMGRYEFSAFLFGSLHKCYKCYKCYKSCPEKYGFSGTPKSSCLRFPVYLLQ